MENIYELVKMHGMINVLNHYKTYDNSQLFDEFLKLCDSDIDFIVEMLDIQTDGLFYKFLRKHLTYMYNRYPTDYNSIAKIESIMHLINNRTHIISNQNEM